MSFLIDTYKGWSAEESVQLLKDYRDYLESVRGDLPESAFKFASADWHYRFQDHYCPHDAWVEDLKIWESASGDREQLRQTQIELRLLGAFHDAHLELNYKNVRSYKLSVQPKGKQQANQGVGHGEWLIDEIGLSENRLVLHEILFSTHSRWLIEASDIQWEWKPIK